MDGVNDVSLTGVLTGKPGKGFPPCTPQACMELLSGYGIDPAGKRAVVVGRSLVAGKPAALMLLNANATVTVCHTGTEDLAAICRECDIVVAAAGCANLIGRDCMSHGQVFIDMGINVDGKGNVVGDIAFADAMELGAAVTPVPDGVGTVTISVLVRHVMEAAFKAYLMIKLEESKNAPAEGESAPFGLSGMNGFNM